MFKTAFKYITQDEKQTLVMNVLTSKQLQADEVKKIKDYEDEIRQMSTMHFPGLWFSQTHPSIQSRLNFLAKELSTSTVNCQKYADLEKNSKKKLKFE